MSAGICIMNRHAIAMAADSAVTIGNHEAIHNSANKLFSLSRVAPIGAIIYANSSFMGVPVEIILKEYEKHNRDNNFPTLNQYLEDFMMFLVKKASFFRFTINEETFINNVFINLVGGLHGDFTRMIQRKEVEKGTKLSFREKRRTAKDCVDATIQFIDKIDKISDCNFTKYIKANYKIKFIKYLQSEQRFEWLNKTQIEKIANKACEIYDKKFERNGYVGFAIAGYGYDEIYPSLIHLHLTGFIDGKIRYLMIGETIINENASAAIVPLAQTDVMQTFLFGINDQFLGYLAKEIPSQIADTIKKMDDKLFAYKKKAVVFQQLVGVTGEILKHMQDVALNNYMLPIYQSVATLPIEELSLLAESMINITSIRRKVALDDNIGTVGGPIDVAIISKGDGFIWLKKKHYFEIKSNPQFLYSHYPLVLGGVHDDE